MASKNLEPFDGQISPAAALIEKLDLTLLFKEGDNAEKMSPVDRYLENSNRLNKISIDNVDRKTYTNDLGILLLLGFVSAVESYLRGIIRGLVQVDEFVQKLVASQQVSYYAAVHHEADMLPEALLEGVSFISKTNVSKALKEYCGISDMTDSGVPTSLEPVFEKFAHICQIRHCCVHRFGLLGATNAFRLSLSPAHFEKPIRISSEALGEISLILEKFVLSLNSYIYSDVLQRSLWMSPVIESQTKINYKTIWNLSAETDKPRFQEYYDLFAITNATPRSPVIDVEYHRFMTWAKASILEDKKLSQFKKGGNKKGPPNANASPTGAIQAEIPSPVGTASDGVPAGQGAAFATLSAEAVDFLTAAATQEVPDQKHEKGSDEKYPD